MRTDSNWIQTYTGRQFWPLDPWAEDVCIEDIAHALSNQCRYTGHTREFYSVAQHSVAVANYVGRRWAEYGLLHDAAEAYLIDLPRPLKREMPDYKRAEEKVLEAIFCHFGLPWPMPAECQAEIEQADLVLLATERRDLMAPPPRPWVSTENVSPSPYRIKPMSPKAAKAQFVSEYKALVHRGWWQMREDVPDETRVTRLEAELATYKQLYVKALACVDQVFQVCAEIPHPILPDYCQVGGDKFEAVIRLAKDYRQLKAALAPFIAVTKGIPDNWPADCRLREDSEWRNEQWQQWLAYWGVGDGGTFPTIGQWRALEVLD